MQTLPDLLCPGLRILSIGLNPSPRSVRTGVYFAHPRNRFWPALDASDLVPIAVRPDQSSMQRLFNEFGIGFTDVVKRSTAGGSDLRAADFRQWAPVLKEQIVHICPLVAWFHGKQAYGGYLRHAEACREPAPGWGLQERTIGNTRVFVSPNPSPANAAYSLSDLIESYRALKACMEVS